VDQGNPPALPPPLAAALAQRPQSDLADVLQRVLDTGVVVVGDVGLVINGAEILNLRLRLIVASIDKAEDVGIDWWRREPAFSSQALPPSRPRVRLRTHRRAALSSSPA
jgi:hypothetical protein